MVRMWCTGESIAHLIQPTFQPMTTTAQKPGRAKRGCKEAKGPAPEEKLTAELVAMLEAGVNPWRREWEETGAGGGGAFRNLLTGHVYRGCNPLLLAMYCGARGYGMPLFVGIAQAKGQGWYPQKGSKGCYILRPQLNKRTERDEEGQEVKGPDGQPLMAAWVSYKPACVFHASDLKGTDEASQQALEAAIAAAMGEQPVKPAAARIEAAEAVLGAWEVTTQWGGDRAFYAPREDAITLPTREQFVNPEACYATWAHEAVHSTGHRTRLGRDLSGFMGSQRYAREELVAELGAYLICQRLQISSNVQNHAAYLGNWAQVLAEGPKVLFKVLSDATKAANLICGPEVQEEG